MSSTNETSSTTIELGPQLGEGAFGEVYVGTMTRPSGLSLRVAVKLLRAEFPPESTAGKRMRDEARALAAVDHPAIVSVHDVIVVHGRTALVTEYVPGADLAVLARHGLPTRPALQIASQIGEALHTAFHTRMDDGRALELVHRDIKPENLRLTPHGVVKLLDFGIAKARDEGREFRSQIGTFVGTPVYMAPEALRGDEQEDCAAARDVYALGCVLFELIASQRLLSGLTASQLRGLAHQPMGLESRIGERLAALPDKDISELVRAMTVDDPRSRPRAGEVAARAETLADRVGGPTVASWCRSIPWPDASSTPGRASGTLVVTPVDEQPAFGGPSETFSWDHAARSEAVVSTVQPASRMRASTVVLTIALTAVTAIGAWVSWERWDAQRMEEARGIRAETRRVALEERVHELLAAGRIADADASVDAFASLAEHRQTPALALALLHHGDRLLARGADTEAVTAFASAYTESGDEAVRLSALASLGEVFADTLQFRSLHAVLVVAERIDPAALAGAPWLDLRHRLAFAGRDFAEAESTSDSNRQRLARSLSVYERLTPTPRAVFPWDVDGDGVEELALWGGDVDGIAILEPSTVAAGPVRTIRIQRAKEPDPSLSSIRPYIGADGRPFCLDIEQRRGARVLELQGDDLVEVGFIPSTLLFDVERADTDGDGEFELYLAENRSLVELAYVDGTWQTFGAHAGTNSSNSEVRDIVAIDVDGDGDDELLLATSNWGAYDLRLLDRRADGQLHLKARQKLGKLDRVTAWQQDGGIKASVLQHQRPHTPLSVQLFHPQRSPVASRGLHILDITADAILPRASHPFMGGRYEPRGRSGFERPWGRVPWFASDLDGDGRIEIIGMRESTWGQVHHQDPAGTFAPLSLDGLLPLAVAQLDDDPAHELLALTAEADPELWALGLGNTPTPAIEWAPISVAAPPDGVVGTVASRWTRAEDLLAVGLFEDAIRQFEGIATIVPGTRSEVLALRRAAEIFATIDDPEGAARSYLAAARPGERSEAELLERAAEAFIDAAQDDLALATLERRMAMSDVSPSVESTVAELRQRLRVDTETLQFSQALPADVRVLDPLGVRWSASDGGVRVTGANHGGWLEFPVRYAGGRAEVSLTVTPHRLDWGGGLQIWLESEEGERWKIHKLGSGGGGGVLHGTVGFNTQTPLAKAPLSALLGRKLEMVYSFGLTQDRQALALVGSDGADRRDLWPVGIGVVPPGDYMLRVAPNPGYRTGRELVLHTLEFSGLSLSPWTASPQDQMRHALASGHLEDALAAMDTTPSVEWVVAFEEAGRLDDTRSSLAKTLAADPDLGGQLTSIFVLHLDRFGPALREVLGDRYVPTFWRHLHTVLSMHGEDAHNNELLLRHLGDLSELSLDTYSAPADVTAHLGLLCRRGAAYRREGQLARAQRDLERALDLGTRGEPRMNTRSERQEWTGWRSTAWLELGLMQIARGDHDRAMHAVLQSVAMASAPEVHADALIVRDDLVVLHTDPRWAEVVAARAMPRNSTSP